MRGKKRGSIEGGALLKGSEGSGCSHDEPNLATPSDLDCRVSSLPEIVQRFLQRKGALLHGKFKPVGDTVESERLMSTRLRVPEGRLLNTFSFGSPSSPDREDFICSIPIEEFGTYETGSEYGMKATHYPIEKDAA